MTGMRIPNPSRSMKTTRKSVPTMRPRFFGVSTSAASSAPLGGSVPASLSSQSGGFGSLSA
jgi:hypothetical protein